ncbi:MAG: MFS transporter [Frankiales bacterium]|nr:MFS transporter [Frankiales bacterium]
MTDLGDGRAAHSPGRARLRDVLAVREYRGMLLAQITSEAGDQIARVALALLVLSHTDSPLLAAATFAVSILPSLFGGALLSPLADRFSRRSVMLGADVLRAVVVALLALAALPGTPLWLLFALLFVAETATPLFASAKAAIVPEVLGRVDLVTYGSGLSRSLSLANQAVGLVLGGVIVQLTDARAALFLDALSFVASFVILLAYLRPRPAALAGAGSIGVLDLVLDMMNGWRLLFSDSSRRALVLLGWGMALPLVAPEAVALAYGRQQGESDGVGALLMAAVVTGAAVGAFLVGRAMPRTQLDLVLPMSIGMSLPLLVTGIEPPVIVLLVLWTLSGMAQAFLVPVMTFTTLFTANENRGAVVGVAAAGFGLLTFLGYLVVGWVATVTSPAFSVVVMAVVGLAVAAVAFLVWPSRQILADLHRIERDPGAAG